MKKMTLEEKANAIEGVLPNVKVIAEFKKNKSTYMTCYCKIHKFTWDAFYGSLRKGCGCPKCKGDKIADFFKTPIEDVRNEFLNAGLNPTFKDYKNNIERLECETEDGYKILISYSHLKRGQKPAKFSMFNPSTIENIKLYLKIHNIPYTLLSEEFKKSNILLSWKCDKGHGFKLSWSSINNGRRCPKCFGKFLKTDERFKIEVYEKVGDEYSVLGEYEKDGTHIKIKHNSCNHEYEVAPSHFLRGRRCPKCAIRYGEENNMYNRNLTEQERIDKRVYRGESIVKWRIDIFERDNYTCKSCSVRGGVVLHAHHLNGYHWFKEGRFDANNGITLCKYCHNSFHLEFGNKNNTKEQFEEFIMR